MTEMTRADLLKGLGLAAVGVTLTTPTAHADADHPHVRLIKDYYATYATGEPEKLRRFFAPDVRWTIPGHHPLSGTKTGVDEVLAFFRELARAGFRADPVFLAAQGDWVVDVHRGWSTTPAGLDILWALAFRIRDRRIAEAVNFAADQHAADAYFWRTHPLAKLPDRLAR